jgi:hypothetical protein
VAEAGIAAEGGLSAQIYRHRHFFNFLTTFQPIENHAGLAMELFYPHLRSENRWKFDAMH